MPQVTAEHRAIMQRHLGGKATFESTQRQLALVVAVAYLAMMGAIVIVVAGLLALNKDPKPSMDVLVALQGSIGAVATLVFGYYFGVKSKSERA